MDSTLPHVCSQRTKSYWAILVPTKQQQHAELLLYRLPMLEGLGRWRKTGSTSEWLAIKSAIDRQSNGVKGELNAIEEPHRTLVEIEEMA